MKPMSLIAVFAENKPAQTARITSILAKAGVNIAWLTIANSGSFGVMKFLVDKLETAMAALKAHSVMASLLDVIAVEVPNRPGALQAVAELLAENEINLANCSGFLANNRAVLVLEAQELEHAKGVLQKKGFKLFSQEEMLHL